MAWILASQPLERQAAIKLPQLPCCLEKAGRAAGSLSLPLLSLLFLSLPVAVLHSQRFSLWPAAGPAPSMRKKYAVTGRLDARVSFSHAR